MISEAKMALSVVLALK